MENIVFFGTPPFAAEILRRIIVDGHTVAAVITQPDKPAGRGNKLTPSAVSTCVDGEILLLKPKTMRDNSLFLWLKELNPSIFITASYGKIFPPEYLLLPKHGAINVHASLLPKYRGAAPIQRAIMNGETETGVSIMYMSEGIDEGDVILTRSVNIGETDTSGELFEKLAELGAEALSEALPIIESGTAQRTPQNSALATYAAPILKSESEINLAQPAKAVAAIINGLSPAPGARLPLWSEAVKIYRAIAGDHGELTVRTADGPVTLLELQSPGGKRMSAADWLRGHKPAGAQ